MHVNLVKIPWKCGDGNLVEDFNFKSNFQDGDGDDYLL